MSPINKFLNDLMTPSRYADDPYTEGANQLSHTALGAIAALVVCIVWRNYFGEMPLRLWTGFSLTMFYLVVIEVWAQDWGGWDSCVDAFFVTMGTLMVLVPTKEISMPRPSISVIEIDTKILGYMIAGTFIVLIARIIPRIYRRYG